MPCAMSHWRLWPGERQTGAAPPSSVFAYSVGTPAAWSEAAALAASSESTSQAKSATCGHAAQPERSPRGRPNSAAKSRSIAALQLGHFGRYAACVCGSTLESVAPHSQAYKYSIARPSCSSNVNSCPSRTYYSTISQFLSNLPNSRVYTNTHRRLGFDAHECLHCGEILAATGHSRPVCAHVVPGRNWRLRCPRLLSCLFELIRT